MLALSPLALLLVSACTVSAIHLPWTHRSHADVAHSKRAAPPAAPELQARKASSVSAAECKAAVKALGDYTIYSEGCVDLIYACLGDVNSTATPWSSASCVAAATCDGTRNLLSLARCQNSAVVTGKKSHYLDYKIFASIVGTDCPQDGCAMTQQNYVDFLYRELLTIKSTNWPNSVAEVLENYWDPIMDWVALPAGSDTIPYRNFADWLVYSDSYAVDDEDDC